MNKRLPLAAAILFALAAITQAPAAQAQNSAGNSADSAADKKDSNQLETVVVTGSLIPQAQIETASPVLTITSAQMKREGFGNVYDALRALPLATGSVQDGQFQGGFTQGAGTLSLLGLDPAFTLTLIDGHPLADYPLLYNGQSNFVDLTNIPMGMIDHIDVLPGNQSSIYGSAAIAGVINIVLKRKVDGVELNYRVGGYDRGGGANQRLELLGGHSFSNGINLTWGVQIGNQNPVWGFQRRDFFSTTDNPNAAARYGTRTFLYNYYTPSGATRYIDPGASTCTPLSSNYGGTTNYQFRAGRGYYCGSTEAPGYDATLASADRSAAGYLHVSDRLNDNVEIYATVLYNADSSRYGDGTRFWTPNGGNVGSGNFFNATTGRTESFQHFFSPEESGGLGVQGVRELKRAYNVYGGARGGIGTSNWTWDAYYDRSEYFDKTKELWPLQDKVDAFFEQQFLGPKLGIADSGDPIYAPDPGKFYQSLTPAQYMSFQGMIASKSKTSTEHLNLQLTNTELFTLPAGAVGVAGIAQVGRQKWSNPAQPELIDGAFWGRSGTSGAGTRNSWAVAGEVRVPVLSTLTANVSARYDDYSNDGGGGDSKATYKLGLEYRPLESLLFRGSYATAFRAPDMGYTFSGLSGSFTTLTDYYRCHVQEPGVPIEDCSYNAEGVFSQHHGNRDLKSITARSFGYGVVYSPTADINVKADYYDVKLKNEVQREDRDLFLRQELACRTGQLDINSPTCVKALSRIVRAAADAPVPLQLLEVDNNPINIASERVAGIVFSGNYRLRTDRFGDFTFGANYNVTTKHTATPSPGDPQIDLLRDPFNSTEFKTVFSGSLGWQRDAWSATLRGTRYGKAPNYRATLAAGGYATPGAGTLSPCTLYNGSVGYSFADKASLTFIVNNIFDKDPPKDPTNTALPYYNYFNYNVYGRQFWLEFDVHFGGK
ncbi:MAG: TonB-dependent receptor [Proteobacteria bacterium]|nr:TonB-dependent receptor [Pseudomonadota bacterium]